MCFILGVISFFPHEFPCPFQTNFRIIKCVVLRCDWSQEPATAKKGGERYEIHIYTQLYEGVLKAGLVRSFSLICNCNSNFIATAGDVFCQMGRWYQCCQVYTDLVWDENFPVTPSFFILTQSFSSVVFNFWCARFLPVYVHAQASGCQSGTRKEKEALAKNAETLTDKKWENGRAPRVISRKSKNMQMTSWSIGGWG